MKAPTRLFPEQQVAYQSCLSPGTFLVWGPPGTGKTRVLKEAIDELMTRGSRVLLVSGTNIAVDNALLGVVTGGGRLPGQIVRVGPPQLASLAQDHSVSLSLMVADQLVEVETRRKDIWRRLADLNRRSVRLRHLDSALVGFDVAEYNRDRALVAAQGPYVAARTEALEQLRHDNADLISRALSAATEVSAAQRTQDQAEDDRQRWFQLDAMWTELKQHDDASTAARELWTAARTAVEESEAAVSDLEKRTGLSALFARRKLEAARAVRQIRQNTADKFRVEADMSLAVAERCRLEVSTESTKVQAVLSLTKEEIEAIDQRVRVLSTSLFELDSRQRAGVAELTRIEELGAKVVAARGRVDAVDRLDLPAAQAEANELRPRVALDARDRTKLEKEYKDVEDKFERLSRDAEGAIINGAQLVATTLARFRTNKRVFNGRYDVVLIDEVGAATLPEVLLAVSRAGRTAVMFGDFMQLGPILPSFRGGDKGVLTPQVQRWITTDVFEHCGVDTVELATAARSPIIGLHQQSRFGPAVMGLVNSLAYDGKLQAGPAVRERQQSGPEIVIIDTDGLGSLAQVHLAGSRSGWWPAGMLLSRMLADFHPAENVPVGIITPYTVQSQATLEGLRDLETGEESLAEVGTAHRFQGREFPIVIFDTVEGLNVRDLWMALATLNPPPRAMNRKWRRDGVRLFNVAATRVKGRIYIIGSLHKIRNAPGSSAFGQLARLIGTPGVECIRGPVLIAPPDTPAEEFVDLSDIGLDLRNVLQRHVVVTDVDDETRFFTTLRSAIRNARHSLWIWSPWVANRVRSLLTDLNEASARGVRITVFVRDENDQLQRQTIELVNELRLAVHRIIPMNVMHQKIIVIDDATVMIGSINSLSQARTREIMVTMQGGHFARRILRHEHATEFSTPPTCPRCRRQDIEIRRRVDWTWYWRCYNIDCPGRRGNVGWNENISLKDD